MKTMKEEIYAITTLGKLYLELATTPLSDIASRLQSAEQRIAATKAELAVVKKYLATAERDRDRWKAVHKRGWNYGEFEWLPKGDRFAIRSPYNNIIASGPTLEAALDAAFALFPLEAK